MRPSANDWITKLALTSHIEGGYFKEIYRSHLLISPDQTATTLKGPRNVSTSIYFLMEQGQFSAFHRIASDEQWHFYFGDPLVVYELSIEGKLNEYLLGNDTEKNQDFHCIIKAGSWFAAKPASGSEYCLVGCTVSPGFNYEDFELAEPDWLIKQYPAHRDLISTLTR
ncbi:MAG: cupin domain-containing protein [Chitinophagaceae bacterium]